METYPAPSDLVFPEQIALPLALATRDKIRSLLFSGSFQAWIFTGFLAASTLLLLIPINFTPSSFARPTLIWPIVTLFLLLSYRINTTRHLVENQGIVFSFIGIVICLSSLFVAPTQAYIGFFVGESVFIIFWRSSWHKALFNSVAHLFALSVALLEVQALGNPHALLTTSSLLLYFFLPFSAGVTGWLNTTIVIGLYSHSFRKETLIRFLKMGGWPELTVCSLGAAFAFTLIINPLCSFFVAVPAFWIVYFQNRFVIEESEKVRLKELHGIVELLLTGKDLATSMSEYVLRASRLLSSDYIQLILFSPEMDKSPHRHLEKNILPPTGFEVKLQNSCSYTSQTISAFDNIDRGFLTFLYNSGKIKFDQYSGLEIRNFFKKNSLREGFAYRLGTAEKMLGVLVAGNGENVSKKDNIRMVLGGNLAIQTTITLERSELLNKIQNSIRDNATLLKRALTDSLTGLGNRDLLQEKLHSGLEDQKKTLAPLGILFLDLDDFKKVNDTFGHKTGDDVLKVVAHRLKSQVRPQDILVRLGGDEFAVLLGDLSQIEIATEIARRVLNSLSSPILTKRGEALIGASIGVVTCSDPTVSPAELLEKADLAMYRAKNGGKNKLEVENLKSAVTV